jgi:hypothetical protein
VKVAVHINKRLITHTQNPAVHINKRFITQQGLLRDVNMRILGQALGATNTEITQEIMFVWMHMYIVFWLVVCVWWLCVCGCVVVVLGVAIAR